MTFVNNILKTMENKDFCVFIITHGRPEKVITYKTLLKCGYTGKVYFVLDNEDKTIEQYKQKFGEEMVLVFDKKEMAELTDEGNNFDNRRTTTHARNYTFKVANELGFTYFIQLDDDYYYFGYRYDTGARIIKNLDAVFSILVDFYKSTNIKSIAFSQGGDHIGGFMGIKLKRKCMNSFVCSTEREFKFIGSLNEDVNTYVTLGSRGDLFFTFTNLQLDQKDTQSQEGGMSDSYNLHGTYVKSFTSIMMHPSSVKISMMNVNNPRLHHTIKWGATTPMIISEKHKKVNESKTLLEILDLTDEPNVIPDIIDSRQREHKETIKVALEPIKNQLRFWLLQFNAPNNIPDHRVAEIIMKKYESFINWCNQQIEEI